MDENISVLIVNEKIDAAGILTNAAFVLGLTAGKSLPAETYGADTVDGDGTTHKFLTNIGHFVRKTSPTKLRALRDAFVQNPTVLVVDYPEDAAPSDYQAFTAALATHKGEEIVYRAVYAYGPSEVLTPLTKNLSRL
jgi:Protein of unknown function (DUF2000)